MCRSAYKSHVCQLQPPKDGGSGQFKKLFSARNLIKCPYIHSILMFANSTPRKGGGQFTKKNGFCVDLNISFNSYQKAFCKFIPTALWGMA